MDKPSGMTSHDVVARVRKILGVKKCGHSGTLDPFATGLLVLCLGRATRLARFVASQPKSYRAGIRFGYATDTYDGTGRALGEDSGRAPSEEDLLAALAARVGRQMQTPPPFSAKKIGGRRAYALARAGREVSPEPVEVEVYELDLESFTPPSARLRVRVSSGTYIRSLAHDLGQALGMGAHLETLRRTAVGSLRVEDAVRLECLAEIGGAGFLEPNALLGHLPAIAVAEEEALALSHGRATEVSETERGDGEVVRVLGPRGRLVAVCEVRSARKKPLVVWARAGETP